MSVLPVFNDAHTVFSTLQGPAKMSEKCKAGCTRNISAAVQQELLKKCWERQEDMIGRYEYIDQHIAELPVQRLRTGHEERWAEHRQHHFTHPTKGRTRESSSIALFFLWRLIIYGNLQQSNVSDWIVTVICKQIDRFCLSCFRCVPLSSTRP